MTTEFEQTKPGSSESEQMFLRREIDELLWDRITSYESIETALKDYPCQLQPLANTNKLLALLDRLHQLHLHQAEESKKNKNPSLALGKKSPFNSIQPSLIQNHKITAERLMLQIKDKFYEIILQPKYQEISHENLQNLTKFLEPLLNMWRELLIASGKSAPEEDLNFNKARMDYSRAIGTFSYYLRQKEEKNSPLNSSLKPQDQQKKSKKAIEPENAELKQIPTKSAADLKKEEREQSRITSLAQLVADEDFRKVMLLTRESKENTLDMEMKNYHESIKLLKNLQPKYPLSPLIDFKQEFENYFENFLDKLKILAEICGSRVEIQNLPNEKRQLDEICENFLIFLDILLELSPKSKEKIPAAKGKILKAQGDFYRINGIEGYRELYKKAHQCLSDSLKKEKTPENFICIQEILIHLERFDDALAYSEEFGRRSAEKSDSSKNKLLKKHIDSLKSLHDSLGETEKSLEKLKSSSSSWKVKIPGFKKVLQQCTDNMATFARDCIDPVKLLAVKNQLARIQGEFEDLNNTFQELEKEEAKSSPQKQLGSNQNPGKNRVRGRNKKINKKDAKTKIKKTSESREKVLSAGMTETSGLDASSSASASSEINSSISNQPIAEFTDTELLQSTLLTKAPTDEEQPLLLEQTLVKPASTELQDQNIQNTSSYQNVFSSLGLGVQKPEEKETFPSSSLTYPHQTKDRTPELKINVKSFGEDDPLEVEDFLERKRNRGRSSYSGIDQFPSHFHWDNIQERLTRNTLRGLKIASQLIALLNKLKIEYFITGSLPIEIILHFSEQQLLTERIFTAKDLDIVIKLPPDKDLVWFLEQTQLEKENVFNFKRIKPVSNVKRELSFCDFVRWDEKTIRIEVVLRYSNYVENYNPFLLTKLSTQMLFNKNLIAFEFDKSLLEELTEYLLNLEFPVELPVLFSQKNISNFFPRLAKYLINFTGILDIVYYVESNGIKKKLPPEKLGAYLEEYFFGLFSHNSFGYQRGHLFHGMGKMVAEGSFVHPLSRKILVPLCKALRRLQSKKMHENQADINKVSEGMVNILQNYFKKFPAHGNRFSEIFNFLCYQPIANLVKYGNQQTTAYIDCIYQEISRSTAPSEFWSSSGSSYATGSDTSGSEISDSQTKGMSS